MMRIWRPVMAAVLVLAWFSGEAGAQTRPLSVEDIVSTEAFGRASLSPDGRWALYERRGAYDTAPRFDRGPRSQWAITDLRVVDLEAATAASERLLPGEPPGLIRGDWSPSGARLLVYRLQSDRLEVGIVTLASRSVTWTGLAAEMPMTGASAQWASDDRVVLLAREDGSLPWLIRYYGASQTETSAAWRRTADGREASRTVMEADRGVVVDQPATDQVLVLLDARNGDQRVLARGRIRDFALSPDVKTLALVRSGPSLPVRPDVIVQSDMPDRGRLSLLDLGGGAERPVEGDLDVAPHLLRWRRDSLALLVWGRRDGQAWGDGRLVAVSPDGATTALASDRLQPRPAGSDIDSLRGVQADWLGDAAILYARQPDGARFDWYLLGGGAPLALTARLSLAPSRLAAIDGDAAYAVADGGVWRMEASGLRRVASSVEGVREVIIGDIEKPLRLRLNDAPRRAWVATTDGRGGLEILTGEGEAAPLWRGDEADQVLAVSPAAALTVSAEGLVETLALRTAEGVRPVDQVNADLAEVVLPKPVRLDHLDAFGRPAQSWLFLPEGRTAASVRGLVLEVYPGSVDSGAWSGPLSLTYSLRAAVLAGAGFAVLSPAMPTGHKELATADDHVRSVDLAVDAALAAYPELPGDRIAVAGHSFGGGVALAIATRSTRYRSYIAWAGTAEMASKWGEFIPVTRLLAEDRHMMRNQQGWVEVGQGAIGAPPWADPQAYVDKSPIFTANRITAPVMLISADRDFVPVSQAEQMFSALYRLGGRVRLVTYWGEEHSLWSPANIRDVYAQIFDWLDLTLAQSPVSPDGPAELPRP
ncbi:alpha/beta hydrolase family protein [Brevundimonas sp.]|uniref:S9 family peptidase n=1 Tax=Brevundimonas sp. TaxID=1871086 RepID=UPI003BAAEF18